MYIAAHPHKTMLLFTGAANAIQKMDIINGDITTVSITSDTNELNL